MNQPFRSEPANPIWARLTAIAAWSARDRARQTTAQGDTGSPISVDPNRRFGPPMPICAGLCANTRSGLAFLLTDWRALMAVFPLAASTTRARFVAATPGVGDRVAADQLRRRAASIEQLAHRGHRGSDVAEEGLVARAEVVQPGITVRGEREPVLRAPAVAGEPDVALTAVARQRVTLGQAELLLPWQYNQVDQPL